MRLTTVFVILLASSIFLTLAFVYSPKEDQATINEISHDSSRVVTPKKNLPERKLVAFVDANPYMQRVLSDYNDFIERAIFRGLAPGRQWLLSETHLLFS